MLRDWGEWELADSVVCCGRSGWRRDLQAGQIFYRFFCYLAENSWMLIFAVIFYNLDIPCGWQSYGSCGYRWGCFYNFLRVVWTCSWGDFCSLLEITCFLYLFHCYSRLLCFLVLRVDRRFYSFVRRWELWRLGEQSLRFRDRWFLLYCRWAITLGWFLHTRRWHRLWRGWSRCWHRFRSNIFWVVWDWGDWGWYGFIVLWWVYRDWTVVLVLWVRIVLEFVCVRWRWLLSWRRDRRCTFWLVDIIFIIWSGCVWIPLSPYYNIKCSRSQ